MARPARREEPDAIEARARAAMEERTGHPLTDTDWEQARHDFLALFHLLKAWSAPIAPNTESPPARTVLSLAITDPSRCC
jgi:hypothetical protein